MNKKHLSEIDLSKPAFSDEPYIRRNWNEEIIYFLMIDRFHDGSNSSVTQVPEEKSYRQEDLLKRQGGNFKGVQSQLAYIKNLGCTTLWLSPVFENDEKDYHGYAITNFLNTDPRFGTISEFKELVKEAHRLGLRVVLDIVINHTGNTWSYEEENPSYKGIAYRFGRWKDDQNPFPTELRNKDYYKKAGAIRNWDSYPETREGDIFELKKLVTDESPIGKEVLRILIKIYSYWIKETGVDGFRLDTVKHLAPSAVAFFCTKINEYASYLGKDSFLIFGEVVGDYSLVGQYMKSIKTSHGYLKGLESALDFPLHFVLEEVVKRKRPVMDLYKWYRSNRKALAKWNKKPSNLIAFIDNHDQIGQEHKARLAFESEPQQVVAMVGFLYFLSGIPCLYYGTEQFLQGNGFHDCWLREPMFDKSENTFLQNQESFLYREISALAMIRRTSVQFLEAEAELDSISVNNGPFVSAEFNNEVIYWSKRVFEDRMILVYNPKKAENTTICAKLSINGLRIKSKFEYVYGGIGEVIVETKEGCGYINIDLNPLQFVILK